MEVGRSAYGGRAESASPRSCRSSAEIMSTHRSPLVLALFLAGAACGCGSSHTGKGAGDGTATGDGTAGDEAALPGGGGSPSAASSLPAAAPELAGWAALLAPACSDG